MVEEILLPARLSDDLKWDLSQQSGSELLWHLQLGIGEFPWEDEMAFQACCLAVKHFLERIRPLGGQTKGVSLYQGPLLDSPQAMDWLRRLAGEFPEEMRIFLVFDLHDVPRAEALARVSHSNFAHFELVLTPDPRQQGDNPRRGICMPALSEWTESFEQMLRIFDHAKMPYRVIHERVMHEQWDGLDEIWILPQTISPRGQRMLLGFEAAGGTVKTFGAEGFEPPTYWSQTSRASQTALCPEK
jgi:hypothetical protein